MFWGTNYLKFVWVFAGEKGTTTLVQHQVVKTIYIIVLLLRGQLLSCARRRQKRRLPLPRLAGRSGHDDEKQRLV